MKYSKCITCGNKTALVTIGANIVLAVLMAITGVIGCSHALVADGIFEAVDVVISLVVLASLQFSEKEPDRTHPYGHGKIEFISSAVVAVVIIFAILFIFQDAINEINAQVSGSLRPPKLISLFVALVSICISEQLFLLNRCAGKELKSLALAANAVYNRFNAFTSALVAVAIVGAMAGIKYLDPAAVMIIAVVMIKTLIEFVIKAYAGLMDTGLSDDIKQQIRTITQGVQGVENIVSITSRSMGRRFWVNLRIELPASLTVSQGYQICETIKETILFRVENIEDVQIETIAAPKEASH